MPNVVTDTVAAEVAKAVLDYLSNQKYQGEEILHAVICCDFVSKQRMITALIPIVQQGLIDGLENV